MQDAFGIVIFVVVIVGAVAALLTAMGSGEAFKQIGRGGLSIGDEEQATGRNPNSLRPAPKISLQQAAAEREAEIRQMLEGRNARREAKGEPPLDIEAEYARLTAPARPSVDPGLEDEIRQMVIARNQRRIRRGKEPLDVEPEVARQVAELQAQGDDA